jgi:DNA-binding transcriptional MocR family regulator
MKSKTDFAYQAVYRYIARLVNEVQADSTKKLPSLRQLARRLRVSISTIQSAYALLEKEGRVCSVPKSGYFAVPLISADDSRIDGAGEGGLLDTYLRHARRPGMTLLGTDQPTLVQSLDEQLLLTERELLRQYPRPHDPGFQPFGDLELRNVLAARYTSDAQHGWYPENVYVGPDLPGMLQAVVETLQLRGAAVLVESPCPWSVLQLLQSLNVRVIELPINENATVSMAGLKQLMLDENIGMAILSSSVNPVSGSSLPWADRRAIAQLLNRYRVWVLENDSHGDLTFNGGRGRLRDLIDPQRLIIMGAFDNTLSLETPYGYLLCRQLAPQWQRYFLTRGFELAPIRQKAIARLCGNGRLDAHLHGLKQLLAGRMLAMARLLDEHLGQLLHVEQPAGGSAIWARSIPPVDMRAVFDSLAQQRILVTPGALFSLDERYSQHLRIGYTLDRQLDLPRLLTALGEALRQAR